MVCTFPTVIPRSCRFVTLDANQLSAVNRIRDTVAIDNYSHSSSKVAPGLADG